MGRNVRCDRVKGVDAAQSGAEPSVSDTREFRSLLDAHGPAALLNVPASWVLAEARAERIPHVRLNRYVRFEADELEAWWRNRRRGPWSGREPTGWWVAGDRKRA